METSERLSPRLSDNDAIDELANAVLQYRAAMDAASRLLKDRNAAIVKVSNLGAPRSSVARLSGLTTGRVQQLLDSVGETSTDAQWTDELRYEIGRVSKRNQGPSIAIGVRRESPDGAKGHEGHGYGGQWLLTGDLKEDRWAVTEALKQLLDMAERNEFDHLLQLEASASV